MEREREWERKRERAREMKKNWGGQKKDREMSMIKEEKIIRKKIRLEEIKWNSKIKVEKRKIERVSERERHTETDRQGEIDREREIQRERERARQTKKR